MINESEGSEEESRQSVQQIHGGTSIERSIQDNQETFERREHLTLHKKQNLHTYTPAQAAEILKENSNRKKRRYEGKCGGQEASKTTSQLENLDETDMFFLSMAKMTKQLPKVEQSQIKLALSNSVLSAEIRYNEQLLRTSDIYSSQQAQNTITKDM